MTNAEIVKALRCLRAETGSLSCLGCGYEHSCNVHGCQILREAAAQLEHFIAENRALRSALASRPAKRAQKQARDASVTYLWERLAAYEGTGLSPRACKQAREIEDGLSGEDYSIARMVEVMNADNDGRVVVLPCKVGDKLYRVFAGEIFEHRVGSMKYFAIQGRWDIETYPFLPSVESGIGKTIFLTREEAEKALAKRESKT